MRLRAVISLFILILSACGTDSPPAPSPPAPTTPAGLWTVSGISGAILRFDSSQLTEGGRKLAADVITTPSAGFGTISPMAFGADDMLWVASASDNLLLGFDRAALSAGGNHAAAIVISAHDSSLSSPTGLAFDRAGALWVTNTTNGTIVRFDATQLRASGSPAPAVIISGLQHPSGIAFDKVGGLWYGERLGNTVNRFTFGELANSGTPMPTVTFTDTLGSIEVPGAIAIDTAGTIWVANVQNSTVVGFGHDQTFSSGAKIPRVTLLSAGQGSFLFPQGLAFDSQGNLWVVDIGGGMQKLAPEQLRASGTPTPALQMQLNGTLIGGLAFFPKPGFGPLN